MGASPRRATPTRRVRRALFAAERVHGGFERSVRVPEFVDSERIDARFSNGLLTITVPKAQAAQARKISIRRGE
jgi:HSP20 family protein